MATATLAPYMYVRCPADREHPLDPRTFVCGQVLSVDQENALVKVKVHDPFQFRLFFEDLPFGVVEFPLSSVRHCSLFIGTEVKYQGKVCTILTKQKLKSGFYIYYLQVRETKQIVRAQEKDIIASLTNGEVDPADQLEDYEFQNPCWFFGHAVVSKSMNILNNSIYGFKELAGSKIYLLPHQVNSIMRCLQDEECRYMLADEVGMGKTVEAISILKIYMQNRSGLKCLIIVPDQLLEQWKKELLLKFNITVGISVGHNMVTIKSVSQLSDNDSSTNWDFVVVDEVHRFLPNRAIYNALLQISKHTKNILLLSATPVQQRKEEYLSLLILLQPEKYSHYSMELFSSLIEKQGKIIQKTALVLDDLGDFEEAIAEAKESKEDPHESEDCNDLYEEIIDYLESICTAIHDDKLSSMLDQISFDSDDCGVYKIKVIISYVCSNYQIESNIIRNRRRILETSETGERLLPTRELSTVVYQMDKDRNTYEAICYEMLSNWITKAEGNIDIENIVRPLLSTFFSSPWAFCMQLLKLEKQGLFHNEELSANAKQWLMTENKLLSKINNILDDPDSYEAEYCTRIVSILNLLYDQMYDQKVVLFTNYAETFNAYRDALVATFSEHEISYFGAGISPLELEQNAYKFQTNSKCHIMLCDYTGGEGRNFQCADYVIHIDLPWDASMIEQRIGRLDRLERDKSRSVVTSVVVYAEDTFEAALFDFWSNGLKIFSQSLSGMEIIMKDINDEIISAVRENFKYGLFDRIPDIIKRAEYMRNEIRKEQNYDAAGSVFKPMYAELRRLIEYYAKNENELFADTMTNWASLAGFRGHRNENGTITYTAHSFSPKSAINSQLIPPRWAEYLNTEQNRFITMVQASSGATQSQALSGTFIRKQAIESDYLHFFAPGDEVFECITNNAMHSCKGKASVFAVPAAIEWKGFVFTWSLVPNEAFLFENNVSIYALSPYRSYMMTDQVTVAVSVDNPDALDDSIILREYQTIIRKGFAKGKTVHLGKRGREAKYLSETIQGSSNIEWFKSVYSEEIWHEMVASAKAQAKEKALDRFKRKSNLRGAKEEMERILSAKAANQEYYGIKDDEIESLQHEQQLILEAIRTSKVTLDSVAFVWMVRTDVGEIDD